ncbi:hypothetical protein PG990_015022 [Apiospora arundinis]|uniref:Transcription initiation factor IIF-like protein n=1 Tax=Apiospora arundinis TaxID=335852 RepID=A0ABR2HM24_9PEZI
MTSSKAESRSTRARTRSQRRADDRSETEDHSVGQKRKRASSTSKMQLERKVKLVTEQRNIDKESPVAEFPMKEWNVKIFLTDAEGNEHPANCFTKVTYNLHPSFANPNQTFTEPPFTCKNEGWGEFEMSIDMFTTEKGGKTTVFHDLNFQSPRYEVLQNVTFKNPSQALINILRETGPVSNEADESKVNKVRKANDGKKRKNQWDFEKMADAMTKLDEDDLLHVIQMIHDHKNDDTYTKNDMEMGEFSVDLFTLPDNLARMIWDFLVDQKKVS